MTQPQVDASKAVLLSRLLKAWEKDPERRLGELLVCAITRVGFSSLTQLDTMLDRELVELVERHVLMMPPKVPSGITSA